MKLTPAQLANTVRTRFGGTDYFGSGSTHRSTVWTDDWSHTYYFATWRGYSAFVEWITSQPEVLRAEGGPDKQLEKWRGL
jgi:hypothetical protein